VNLRLKMLALSTGAVVLVAAGLFGLRGVADAAGSPPGLTEDVLRQAETVAADPDAHLYAQLQLQLQRQPDDERALVLKARLDMRAQRFEQAAAGFERALARHAKVALDPGVWVEHAEARAMMQGQSLAGEPQRLLEQALALDAGHPQALDLAGSAAWELRDFARAAAYWKRLLAQVPSDAPRHAALSLAIAGAEQRAKLSLRSP
jgi:cytochrome c-type biogenesis protein CcmH